MIPSDVVDDLFQIFTDELSMPFIKADSTDETPEGAQLPESVFATYKIINEEVDDPRNHVVEHSKIDSLNTKITTKKRSFPIISINFVCYDQALMNKNNRIKAGQLINLIEDASENDLDLNDLTIRLISPQVETRDSFIADSGYEYISGFDIMIDYEEITEKTIESINSMELSGSPIGGDGGVSLPDQVIDIP